MDTELLVDSRIEDGRKLLAELIHDGFDVTVAFWCRTSEEGLCFLYIGSNSVEPEKLGDAYRRVYACLSRISNAAIALSEIKLVDASNPIAKDAMAVRDRYPARTLTRYQGKRLGNLSIEEACIYPPDVASMVRRNVLQTVLDLMNRGVPQPSIVTLRDGSTIKAIPTAIDWKSPGTIQIVFKDVITGTNRDVSADDVANIQ